jgi:hypothetical protein
LAMRDMDGPITLLDQAAMVQIDAGLAGYPVT